MFGDCPQCVNGIGNERTNRMDNMETVNFIITLLRDNPIQGIPLLALISVGLWRFVLMTYNIITRSQATTDTAVKGIISGEERGDGLLGQLINLKASDSKALERIADSGEKSAAADLRIAQMLEHHDTKLTVIGETVGRVDLTSLATKKQVDDILQRVIQIETLYAQERKVTRRIGAYIADTRQKVIALIPPQTVTTGNTETKEDEAA